MTLHLEPEELKLAEKIAGRIGSKWTAVSIDDLTGHLYLWLLTNIKSVERWRQETGDGKLYVSLRREAAKYCAKEQAAAVGRPISAGNFYTVDLLNRALPYIFEDIPQTITAVNPVTGKPEGSSAEPGLAMTILADIKSAYHGLNKEIKEVLAWRYRDGLTLEEIGELRDLTKAGAGKSVERALLRLSDSLTGNPL